MVAVVVVVMHVLVFVLVRLFSVVASGGRVSVAVAVLLGGDTVSGELAHGLQLDAVCRGEGGGGAGVVEGAGEDGGGDGRGGDRGRDGEEGGVGAGGRGGVDEVEELVLEGLADGGEGGPLGGALAPAGGDDLAHDGARAAGRERELAAVADEADDEARRDGAERGAVRRDARVDLPRDDAEAVHVRGHRRRERADVPVRRQRHCACPCCCGCGSGSGSSSSRSSSFHALGEKYAVWVVSLIVFSICLVVVD